jgi:hypothetical protein
MEEGKWKDGRVEEWGEQLSVSSSSPILAVLHGRFSPQPLPSFHPSILPFCKIVQKLTRDSRQAWLRI